MNGPTVIDVSARVRTWLLGVIAAILIGAALEATYFITVPLVFAFFLAILVLPIKQGLTPLLPHGLKWIALALALLAILVVLATVLFLVSFGIGQMAQQVPQYSAPLRQYYGQVMEWAQRHNLHRVVAQTGTPRLFDIGASVITSIWSVLALLVLTFFFTLLMLLEVRFWRIKTVTALREPEKKYIARESIRAIAERIRQYMVIQVFISGLSGLVEGLWLWIMGIKLAFILGLLYFILNFIPYVGSVIAMSLTTLASLLQFGLHKTLLIIGVIIVIEQIIGNFLAPRLQGQIMRISPIVLLLAITFWAWVWGVAGAILAIPMTVSLIIICAHVEALRPVAILLSHTGRPQEAIDQGQETSE